MPRVYSERTRQAILVNGDPLTDLVPVDKLEVFDEAGAPVNLAGTVGPAGPTGPAGPASTVPGPAGAAGQPRTLQDEGVARPVRTNVNFVGTGVSLSDDSGNDRTIVTIPGPPSTATMRTPHGFLIGGDINAAVVVPDLHVPEASNQATTLVAVIARLDSGTSIDVTVRKNGGAVGTAKTVTGAKQTFSYSDAIANGDAFDLTFANPVGSPKDLGVTLILEHVLTLA